MTSSVQDDVERIAAALRAADLNVVDVKPTALLVVLPQGGHLMIGVQRCK